MISAEPFVSEKWDSILDGCTPYDYGSKSPILIEAKARTARHLGHASRRPLSRDYELSGLRGEEALGEFLSRPVDLTPRPGGDKGIDNRLFCKDGTVLIVDVKAATIKSRVLLPDLLVETRSVKDDHVYVLADYHRRWDVAELVGWQWGREVRRWPAYHHRKGIYSHRVGRAALRALEELKDMMDQKHHGRAKS